MTENYKVLSFDPSLRNWGYAVCELTKQDNDIQLNPITGGVIHSDNAKDVPYVNLRDLQTASNIYENVKQILAEHKIDYLVAELPVGSQSARAMASYGICIGLIGAIARETCIPLLSVTPAQVKKVVGEITTTKEEIIAFTKSKYPQITDWLPKAKSKQEHICDAIIAAHSLVTSEK